MSKGREDVRHLSPPRLLMRSMSQLTWQLLGPIRRPAGSDVPLGSGQMINRALAEGPTKEILRYLAAAHWSHVKLHFKDDQKVKQK